MCKMVLERWTWDARAWNWKREPKVCRGCKYCNTKMYSKLLGPSQAINRKIQTHYSACVIFPTARAIRAFDPGPHPRASPNHPPLWPASLIRSKEVCGIELDLGFLNASSSNRRLSSNRPSLPQ